MGGANGPDLESVLEGCRQGDPLAWEALVRGYQNRVYGLARNYIREPETARDVAQEVFLRIYRKLAFCPPAAEFLPWMLAIARNACIDHLRRMNARKAERFDSAAEAVDTLVDSRPSPEEGCERSLLRRRIRRALDQVTALNREIIVLKEIQGLSLEEVAAILKVPLGTIKSRAHRARFELAHVLMGMDAPLAGAGRRED